MSRFVPELMILRQEHGDFDLNKMNIVTVKTPGVF